LDSSKVVQPASTSSATNGVTNNNNATGATVKGVPVGTPLSSPKPGNKPEINEDMPASRNPVEAHTESDALIGSFEKVKELVPLQHPHPAAETLQLHKFFSLERPLLLLTHPQPTNIIFSRSPSGAFERLGQATRHASTDAENPAEPLKMANGEFGMGIEDPDADADAARLLSRSLVMQNITSRMEWDTVLSRLGFKGDTDIESLKVAMANVQMDSVKRKRRKKITKHKYKKRRKLQRAERRRLGK
jgi:ribosomal protein L21